MKSFRASYLVLFVLLYYSGFSFAEIYKCRDAKGTTVYSDTACDTAKDREKLNIEPAVNKKSGWRGVVDRFLSYFFPSKKKDNPTSLANRPSAGTNGASQNSNRSSDYSHFKCSGKVHCAQMRSCEEATFYLNNCPDVKLDGDRDGVPCELQWCD